jgi:hypothetical protein
MVILMACPFGLALCNFTDDINREQRHVLFTYDDIMVYYGEIRSGNATKKMKMQSRGVTRMHHRKKHSDGNMEMQMNQDEKVRMMQTHHTQILWIYWMLIILGVWLIMSPLTFDYGKNPVSPSGGRELWLSLSHRISLLKWSDMGSGLLLIFFGWRSLTPNRPYSVWACCFIGIWLSFAPLVLWSPTAVTYLNDTLVGMLIISLTILIPGMPNMMMVMKMGSEIPQGWSYNPSSWAQRWIMIVTGFLGFIVSRYLAAFQLGYIDTVWDPFFGQSSMNVLNSSMSKSLPVSDAGLGSLAYTFEFLMGFMGSPSRWRTMPWMVAFFGILVIPLGLVHIFLVISQPLTVGAWCTWCIAAAGVMLPMIPLEVDEVVAMGQHMVQATRRGEKFWNVFWKGGQPVEMNNDERSPELEEMPHQFTKIFNASLWGMSAPWTLLVSIIIGVGIVALPDNMNIPIKATVADVNHLCGSLIVVVAVISMGEVVRVTRYVNILLGLALAAIPWLIEDTEISVKIIDVLAGIIVVALSVTRGIKKEQYGLWDKYVR